MSLSSTSAAVSPARGTASALQSQPSSQARHPPFVEHYQQQQQRQQLQPLLQHSTNQQHIPLAQTPIQTQTQTQTQTTILYPLAPSGHGLLPTLRPQLPEQRITVANPCVYPLSVRSIMAAYHPPSQTQHQQARLFASSDSSQPPLSSYPVHTPFLHASHSHMSAVSAPTVGAGIRGTSVSSQVQSKVWVALSSCFAPGNGHEEPVDKSADDLFISVRDRKVRISDGASIYAFCRSWLRNGYPEESQVRYGDFIQSLPKPSPMPMSESSLLKRKQNDDETEIEEDEKSIGDLNAKELLQRHVKRAKRVRARLREERLQRIARYKGRLALLLPQ